MTLLWVGLVFVAYGTGILIGRAKFPGQQSRGAITKEQLHRYYSRGYHDVEDFYPE